MAYHIKKESLLLYAVTDRKKMSVEELAKKVEASIKGGVSFVQLREKNISDEEYIRIAMEIKSVTERFGVPFVVNDNVYVALKSGADGVHLGQSDMEIREARKILGRDKIIGATAHNTAEAVAVYEAGADYIGAGACFGSTTKKDTVPLSYEELCNICNAVPIPVVAIGGINVCNVSKLSGSGIAGAAVVSAIFGGEDAGMAALKLRHKLELVTYVPESAEEHLKKVYQPQTAAQVQALCEKKAAIFDMDGTILDSMPMWEHLASEYVESMGAVPDDDLDIRIKTMTIYEAADYVRERYKLKKGSEDIVSDINSMVYEEYGQRLKLKPGVYEFLLALKKRGIKLALATATEYNLALSAMTRLGLYAEQKGGNILDEICTCSMAGQGKNKPDVYFMACKKLGVKREDVIIYEDSFFAIQTAKRAGFKTAAVFDSAERDNWCGICELSDYKMRFE